MVNASNRVSVVLPAYYSYSTLPQCLDALRSQTFQDFEVIVVNSSPECVTAEVIKAYPEVHFVQSGQRLLPHAARNAGVTIATGEVLVFSDPDCMAADDWLERLVLDTERSTPSAAVLGGAMDLDQASWLSTGIHLTKFHRLLPRLKPGERWILPTANVAYPRTVWDAVGPFEGDVFCGDAILGWRAAAAGFDLHFKSDAVVRHRHSESLRVFLAQRLGRGQEFLESRLSHQERWPAWRLAASLALAPLLGLWVTLRAGRDAVEARWLIRYLHTLPIQLLGHCAWSLGESVTAAKHLFGRKREQPLHRSSTGSPN